MDGQSVPTDPLQPNYKAGSFIEAYNRLEKKPQTVKITRKDFVNGYCLYLFNIEGDLKERDIQRGHTRLELKFTEALPAPVTAIVYAKFPSLMKIDSSRNIILE